MRFGGLDLGGRGAVTTALSVVEERGGDPHLVSVEVGPDLRGPRGDAALVRACVAAGVTRAAIDAPLSLPHAVTCADERCARCLGGEVSPATGSRRADRAEAWAAAGHPEKPPMATAMIAGIAFRAIHLARRFAVAGIACDETWPMGTYRALLRATGHTGPVPDDARRRALAGAVGGLDGVIGTAAIPAGATRDALDAVAAAFCAWAIATDRATPVGDPAEGVIWVAPRPPGVAEPFGLARRAHARNNR
jgi:predicted nuclease with RNAse H fold